MASRPVARPGVVVRERPSVSRSCRSREHGVFRGQRPPAGLGSPRALDSGGSLRASVTRSQRSRLRRSLGGAKLPRCSRVTCSAYVARRRRERSPFHSARRWSVHPSARTVPAWCVDARRFGSASTPCGHAASYHRPATTRVGMEGAAGSTRPGRRKDRNARPERGVSASEPAACPDREDRSESRTVEPAGASSKVPSVTVGTVSDPTRASTHATPTHATRQRFIRPVHYPRRDDTACRAHAGSWCQRRDRAPSSRDSRYCRGRIAPTTHIPSVLPRFSTSSVDSYATAGITNQKPMHDETHHTPDRRRYRP
jgi:hypothetical protein